MVVRRPVPLTPVHELARLRRSLPEHPGQLDDELWHRVHQLLSEYEHVRIHHRQALHELAQLPPVMAALRGLLNTLHRLLVDQLDDQRDA